MSRRDTRKRSLPARVRRLLRVASGLLTVAAVVQELRTPRERRQWHGLLAGFVPYDFRRPTAGRVRSRMWSPQDERLLLPQAFGVGWTVNLGRLMALVRSALVRGAR